MKRKFSRDSESNDEIQDKKDDGDDTWMSLLMEVKKSLDEESVQRKIQIDREVAERKKELEFLNKIRACASPARARAEKKKLEVDKLEAAGRPASALSEKELEDMLD